MDNARQVNADAEILEVSARSGAELPAWLDWVRGVVAAARQF
jgi:hypothetical protein